MNIRYLRAWTNGSTVNTGNYWVLLQVYDTNGTHLIPTAITTSGSVTAENAGTLSTINSDTNSYCAIGSGNQYIQIDLGSIQACNKVVLLPYYKDEREFYNLKVEISTDGSTWQLVATASQLFKLTEAGLIIFLNNRLGIFYNNNPISINTSIDQFPYYNNSQLNQVYYNGNLVWRKYTPLEYTFSGSTVTGYIGTASEITIPSSYSTILGPDGAIIFVEGSDTVVTSIGNGAFESNTTLTSVTIPSTITTIGKRAFQFCYNLTLLTIEAETISNVGYCAFALTNISFTTSKALDIFENCPNLGQGALASRDIWNCGRVSKDKAQNLIKAHIGELKDGDYTGHGTIIAAGLKGTASKQTGGSDSVSGTYSAILTYCYDSRPSDTDTCLCSAISNVSFGTTAQNSNITYWVASFGTLKFSFKGFCSNSTLSNMDSTTSYIGLSSSSYDSTTYKALEGQLTDFWANLAAVGTCITQGTLITLADGTQKPIEDLTYKDLLLVWNFDTGTYDYQYPLTIMKGYKMLQKYRITLEDNTYIDICGRHDIYDPVDHTFRTYGEGAIISLGDNTYHVLQYLSKNQYAFRKVTSIEIIQEEVQSYGIITGGTITAFANNIMIGMDTLNRSPIGESNSFEKSFEKDKELCYTYNRFKEEIYDKSEKYLILGLNLHYVDYYHKERAGLDQLLAPFNARLPVPKQGDKYVCTVGFLDGDTLTETEYLEDEEITLPEITSELKTHWYTVGDHKLLKPGDKYKVNYSTLIRAI